MKPLPFVSRRSYDFLGRENTALLAHIAELRTELAEEKSRVKALLEHQAHVIADARGAITDAADMAKKAVTVLFGAGDDTTDAGALPSVGDSDRAAARRIREDRRKEIGGE